MNESSELLKLLKSRGNTNPRLRRMSFTLNNYTDIEFTHLLTEFEKYKYIIGKEVGESGTPHLQGYVEFGKQVSFTQIKKINKRMHFASSKGNRKENVKYCSKDGDFVTNIPVERNIRLLSRYENVVWKDWQAKIIQIIETGKDCCSRNFLDEKTGPETAVPDFFLDEKNSSRFARKIWWFWEKNGNVGKSFLCKYLYLKYDAIICNGKKDDVFNQVNTWLQKHEDDEDPKVVVCDVPRSAIEYFNYGALEKLKDGLFYSGKYEGGICAFDPPVVICCANSLPNLGEMSMDRWEIYDI